MKTASLLLRAVVALILVQSLFFKFSAAPESIYIFTTLGMEPVGRYGIGTVELIASILLFVPGMLTIGAALALGTMAGAIMGHLTKLGIEVQGDHGLLFGLACVVFASSLALLVLHRKEIPLIGARL
jgi:uncharacterized membrane protein YphA (DoxX/SURF4 family)